jgi:hypothetical protein
VYSTLRGCNLSKTFIVTSSNHLSKMFLFDDSCLFFCCSVGSSICVEHWIYSRREICLILNITNQVRIGVEMNSRLSREDFNMLYRIIWKIGPQVRYTNPDCWQC